MRRASASFPISSPSHRFAPVARGGGGAGESTAATASSRKGLIGAYAEALAEHFGKDGAAAAVERLCVPQQIAHNVDLLSHKLDLVVSGFGAVESDKLVDR